MPILQTQHSCIHLVFVISSVNPTFFYLVVYPFRSISYQLGWGLGDMVIAGSLWFVHDWQEDLSVYTSLKIVHTAWWADIVGDFNTFWQYECDSFYGSLGFEATSHSFSGLLHYGILQKRYWICKSLLFGYMLFHSTGVHSNQPLPFRNWCVESKFFYLS